MGIVDSAYRRLKKAKTEVVDESIWQHLRGRGWYSAVDESIWQHLRGVNEVSGRGGGTQLAWEYKGLLWDLLREVCESDMLELEK